MLEELPGGERLDEATRIRIADAAEGNPLFLEQLLASSGKAWSSVTSRSCHRRSRRCSQPASIVSAPASWPSWKARRSWEGVLARGGSRAVAVERSRRSAAHLDALVRKEFIRRGGAGGGSSVRPRPHPAGRLPQPSEGARAEHHERFAAWLIAAGAGGIGELEEIAAITSSKRRSASPSWDRRAPGPRRSPTGRATCSWPLAAAQPRAAMIGRPPTSSDAPALSSSSGYTRLPALEVALAEALYSTGQLKEAEALWLETMQAAVARGDRRSQWLATIELAWLRRTARARALESRRGPASGTPGARRLRGARRRPWPRPDLADSGPSGF